MIKRLLLTFDLEELERAGDRGFTMGYEGGRVVQALCEKFEIPVTFFSTSSFGSRFPDLVRELADSHEIAFHGFAHQDDYQSMDEDEALSRLSRGKTMLEHIMRKQIHGFRAPRMRPPSYRVLRKAGFLYSSSLHPTCVPGRYNHLKAPCAPFIEENVMEIPVSVSPILRLPVSWVWFRQLGTWYARFIIKRLKTDHACMYFHPWEFIPLSGYGGIVLARNTGEHLKGLLEEFLHWILPHVEPLTMVEFAREWLYSCAGQESRICRWKKPGGG
ncbi:MAG: polysaccharide deacetylase family protein [Theionarchaea archaeon]|nr:polysaccharide deacetylase family protein [Theionarchaea archaeon]